jgi:hypothetical protein
LTDPKSGQQFTMVLGHPETAQTLTGEPYTPSGAQRVGTTAQAGAGGNVDTVAKGIAEYRMAPLTSSVMRGPWGQAVMNRVLELNPEYQSTEYGARASGARAFASGRQSDTVRSMSVVIDHLATLQDLGEALQNGDVRKLSELEIIVGRQFGVEGAVDFNAAKEIVGDEIAKAVIGGVNSERDRAALHDKLDAANSPAQMLGVIRTFKKLLTGQLGGLRQQYEHATGKSADDFDQLLSPRAREELGGTHPGGGAPQPGAVMDGYRFKGGDPADPNSWEKQ